MSSIAFLLRGITALVASAALPPVVNTWVTSEDVPRGNSHTILNTMHDHSGDEPDRAKGKVAKAVSKNGRVMDKADLRERGHNTPPP